MSYKIKVKMRMTGSWLNYYTGEGELSKEEAEDIFNQHQYSTDYSNMRIVDKNENIVRDWQEEQK